MSGALDEPRLTLKSVAERLDVHITTVWRWTLTGVRGRRLRSHMIGGRRYVSLGDLDAFVSDPTVPNVDPSPDRQSRSEAASKLLDARGVKAR